MLFQPHWKLDGGRDADSLTIRQSGTRLSHSVTMIAISSRARCTPRQKCCPRPKASSRSIGRSQMNSSGSVYSRSSRLADAEQRDDPLTRLDRGAVNGERLAHGAGEPLRGRAVPDHLLARHGHIGIEIRTHRGHLVGPPAQLPQPVRDDLRHGLRPADEDAEHLDGGLHVGERGTVRQAVAEQVVDDRQLALGCAGAPALHDRDQVLEITGPGVGHLDAASRLGQASRVDGRQHIGRQIDWQTEQFADHRRGDDAAVVLGQVECAARQQFVEPLVGQRADPVGELGDRLRPELSSTCSGGRCRRSGRRSSRGTASDAAAGRAPGRRCAAPEPLRRAGFPPRRRTSRR